MLDHHRDQPHDVGQVYHAGWVKPAGVWHDASLYRMVRQAETDLVREGDHVRRVVLDDELKARAYQALHEARTEGCSVEDAHRAVAAAQHLHVEDGTVRVSRCPVGDRGSGRRRADGRPGVGHRALPPRARGRESVRRIPDVRRAFGQHARRHAARSPRRREARPMTPTTETASVLEAFGYTTRQAQFLALVAVHGGYFLRRQFVAFTRGSHGLATVRFLDRAVTRGDIRSLPYGRQGRVFHVCARPLYAALGEEHNRNRRVAEWDAVTRKLMTLDFVLAHPNARFWATEADKASCCRSAACPTRCGHRTCTRRSGTQACVPRRATSSTRCPGIARRRIPTVDRLRRCRRHPARLRDVPRAVSRPAQRGTLRRYLRRCSGVAGSGPAGLRQGDRCWRGRKSRSRQFPGLLPASSVRRGARVCGAERGRPPALPSAQPALRDRGLGRTVSALAAGAGCANQGRRCGDGGAS